MEGRALSANCSPLSDAFVGHDLQLALIGRKFRLTKNFGFFLSVIAMVMLGFSAYFAYYAIFTSDHVPPLEDYYRFQEIIGFSPPPLRIAELVLLSLLCLFYSVFFLRILRTGDIIVLDREKVTGIDWRGARISINYAEIRSVRSYSTHIKVFGKSQNLKIFCRYWGMAGDERRDLAQFIGKIVDKNISSFS